MLERVERRARQVNAPVLAYETARVRARALIALGKGEHAAVYVQTAAFLAARGGWQNRIRAVQEEFGAVSGSSTGTGTMNGQTISANTYRRRLDALQQVSLAAATVFDPRELAQVALRETLDIFGAERAFLFLDRESDGRLVPHLGQDAAGNELSELAGYGASLVARVHASGQPLVVTGTEDGEVHGSASAVAYGLRSIMVAPLRLKGRPLGVVYLDSRVAKGIFTTDDADILMAITNQVAVSLETARAAQLEVAVRAADQRRDIAEQLRLAMSEVSATLDPDEVLGRLLTAVSRALRADATCLVRPDGQVLGGAPPVDPGADAMLAGLLGTTTPSRGTGRVPAAALLPGARSWVAVPLLARGTLVGLLIVTSMEEDAYGEAHLQIAGALAGHGMTAYENARLFDQVQELATVDSMTGVPNRRHFLALADTAFAAATPGTQPLTALMLDIDHFKQINDRYGHLVGDAVIEEIGARLRSALREGDLVGRYGGEEFAVVVTAEPDRADELAQRLLRVIAATPVLTSVGPIDVTVSVGASRHRVSDADLGVLLGRADEALYTAKATGRNRVATA
jgi:diguanylate cyclase (GGDEF)-like protein